MMEKPPCFTSRVIWGMTGLHIHTAKRLKDSAASPFVRFNALSPWAGFLRLESFVACSSRLMRCGRMWRRVRICWIITSARSR
jgi:hypothetical protein